VVDKEHLALQLSNYGAALRGVGKSRRAAECFAESLQLMEALGERTPNLVRVMMNLAATRRQLGEHEAAIELLERALPLAREISGPEHPDVATCLVNLGAARFYGGEREAGEELFRGALELRRKIYGELHPELGRPYEWLAQCARVRGERDAACEFAGRASDALTSAFERTHPEVLSIRAYHGRLLAEAGRGEQAVALLEANFAAVREVGVRSPQYDVALDAYVFALGVAGRWDEALATSESSYAELERELAEDDPGRAGRLAARAAALVKFCASWAAAEPASRASEVEARWRPLAGQRG
jgi:tetratricopeptide (TPR) repeat protein